MRVSAEEVMRLAGGRSIVVGENHVDRRAREAMLLCMNRAHEEGYRALGVEICLGGTGRYWGLADELAYLESVGPAALSEFDRRSYIDRRFFWQRRQRMNRQWFVQDALLRGWKIEPIDPCHWHWERGGIKGYLGVRETEMVRAVRSVMRSSGSCIINCGSLHLEALARELGDEVFCVSATSLAAEPRQKETEFQARVDFARSLPLLVAG